MIFPDEILLNIFSFVSSFKSLNLKLTSKLFYNLCDVCHDPNDGIEKVIRRKYYDSFLKLINDERIIFYSDYLFLAIDYLNYQVIEYIFENHKIEDEVLNNCLSKIKDEKTLDIILKYTGYGRIRDEKIISMIENCIETDNINVLKIIFKSTKINFNFKSNAYYYRDLLTECYHDDKYDAFKLLLNKFDYFGSFIESILQEAINDRDKKFYEMIISSKSDCCNFSMCETYTEAFKNKDEEILDLLKSNGRECWGFPVVSYRMNDWFLSSKEENFFEEYFADDLDYIKLAHKYNLLEHIELEKYLPRHSSMEIIEYVVENNIFELND